METLVVGCDASGKSTFCEAVQLTWGDTMAESTRSEEASRFKREHHRSVIDAELIDERERLYLKLSHQALIQAQTIEGNYISSDSSLVTRLSHSAMRQVITEPYLTNEEVIEAWQSDLEAAQSTPPDILVHTHADAPVLLSRMRQRQATDSLEHFWGFNSPLFLDVYQKRWKEVIGILSHTSLDCVSLDTGTTSIEKCLVQYGEARFSTIG